MRLIGICLLAITFKIGAKPLLGFSDRLWNAKTHVFLGNCTQVPARAKAIQPKEAWIDNQSFLVDFIYVGPPQTQGFQAIKAYQTFVRMGRRSKIYALASEGTHGGGTLYRLSEEGGRTESYFSLPYPIEEGYLVVQDVLLKQRWHTLLIVVGTDQEQSCVYLFDISDTESPLQPMLRYEQNEFSRIQAPPVWVRLSNGVFGVFLIGNTRGGLIKIGQTAALSSFTVTGGAFSALKAVDRFSVGWVSEIYGVNAAGLWRFDLEHTPWIKPKQILKHQINGGVIPFLHPSLAGLRLYFLGATRKAAGLFRYDTLSRELSLVLAGDYQAIHPRAGKLLLMPKWSDGKVSVIDENEQIMVQGVSLDIASSRTITTRVLWDPVQKIEKIITLNASCQLSVVELRTDKNRYNRVGYRFLE